MSTLVHTCTCIGLRLAFASAFSKAIDLPFAEIRAISYKLIEKKINTSTPTTLSTALDLDLKDRTLADQTALIQPQTIASRIQLIARVLSFTADVTAAARECTQA